MHDRQTQDSMNPEQATGHKKTDPPLLLSSNIAERTADDSSIHSDLDISFLVVAADLWSADGTEDMNLVQHPAPHYRKSMSPGPNEGYRPSSSYEDPHRFSYASGGPSGLKPPSSSGVQAEGVSCRALSLSCVQEAHFSDFVGIPGFPDAHEAYSIRFSGAAAIFWTSASTSARPSVSS